jgi:hypothetical protein
VVVNSTVTGLTWGVLAVATGEAIQAAATHHLRRLGACALAGAAVAAGLAAYGLSQRHKQLAAAAAAAHQSLPHLMAAALGLLAALVTVTGYIVATVAAGRRRYPQPPAERW